MDNQITQQIETINFFFALLIILGMITYWKIMVLIDRMNKYFKYKNEEIEEKSDSQSE